MDTGVYGRARGDGPEFHLGLRKRQEGNLHSQFVPARHCFRYDHFEINVPPLMWVRINCMTDALKPQFAGQGRTQFLTARKEILDAFDSARDKAARLLFRQNT